MVRFARETDRKEIKNIWKVCFGDSNEYINWFFAENFCPETTIVAECDGKPVAAMQLLPFTLRLGDKSLDIRYISGVSTLPEYRGRGLARKMFDFSVPVLQDMGCDISILASEVDGMYEKFGYEKIFSPRVYTVDSLCGTADRITDDLINKIDRIYRTEMQKRCAYVSRTKTDWTRILTDVLKISKGRVFIENDSYALAYPKGDGYIIPELFGRLPEGARETDSIPVMARIINGNIGGSAEQLFKENAPIYVCFPQ